MPQSNSSPGEPILSVSPYLADHVFLRSALQAPQILLEAHSFRDAVGLLCKYSISAVICERDLPDGNWRDLLSLLAPVPDPPALIVTSKLADEHLWAEVLNLGGYDVLAKPFDAEEVVRVVQLACGYCRRQREPHPKPVQSQLAGAPRAMTAAALR